MNIKIYLFLIAVFTFSSCTSREINDGVDDIISFIGTVIIIIIIAIVVIVVYSDKNKKGKKIIRCDGCRKVINGKYLAIKPEGTTLKFDYCSRACKAKSHEKNLKDIEVYL